MDADKFDALLKDKIVCDFRGYPIGRVKKLWIDDAQGPFVVVERHSPQDWGTSWETIPLRAIDTIREQIKLKPPTYAE
ncbi:MAG: hypothetical protein K9W43_13385 [Candidatus Thorarchaeota archaeon]|nr:hypothetical protein [Candidatus Thorarchaeota archaeon]